MTGHAFITGVSTKNPGTFTANALPGVEKDLENLPPFFRKLGFQTTVLADSDATHDAVLDGIKLAANQFVAGDFFVFAFSGHGAEKTGPGGDESQDELLLTYDKEIVDDELGELWPTFAAGVRIVVLTDSCHSGTAYKDAVKIGEAPPVTEPEPARPAGIGLPGGGNRSGTRGGTRDAYRIDANLIHLSGCLDTQQSQDTGLGGAFSRALTDAMNQDQPTNYDALHRSIQNRLRGYDQTSQMNEVGPTVTAFKAEKPFQLKYRVSSDADYNQAVKDLSEDF